MANRRMFSKTITSSSSFLMMPVSARELYFQLGMNADDDGFCEHFAIMRMVEAKPDDLKILAAKEFVKVFDEKVLIILDWNENNYIRLDRYTPSKYQELYREELKKINFSTKNSGQPNDNQLVDERSYEVRLGKVRLGKVRLGKDSLKNEIFSTLKKIFPEVYKEIHNDKPDFSNKDYIIMQNLAEKAIKSSEDPILYISNKLQGLKIKCQNDKRQNRFWYFTPAKLMSGWNEITYNKISEEDNSFFSNLNFKEGK